MKCDWFYTTMAAEVSHYTDIEIHYPDSISPDLAKPFLPDHSQSYSFLQIRRMQSLWKMFTCQLLMIRLKKFKARLDMVLLTVLGKSELASKCNVKINVKLSILSLVKTALMQYYIASICSFIIKSLCFHILHLENVSSHCNSNPKLLFWFNVFLSVFYNFKCFIYLTEWTWGDALIHKVLITYHNFNVFSLSGTSTFFPHLKQLTLNYLSR